MEGLFTYCTSLPSLALSSKVSTLRAEVQVALVLGPEKGVQSFCHASVQAVNTTICENIGWWL